MAAKNDSLEEFRIIRGRHDPDGEPGAGAATYWGGEPVYGTFSVGPHRMGPGSAVEPQAPTEETPIWLAA